jgi:hypothetical protein
MSAWPTSRTFFDEPGRCPVVLAVLLVVVVVRLDRRVDDAVADDALWPSGP